MAEQDQEDQDDLESDHESIDAEFGLSGVRRPMNAFFIFCKRHRDIVREKYPHLENRSITKILGEWWANLNPSEKSSYTALAKQYKEAFMKANPDFKWYKIPTPPTRTLVTRPSNQRCLQMQKEKKKSSPCGITLGKLADDTQLGGLSSLISPMTSVASSSTSAVSSTSHALSPNNILKPPKKRYIINGEFRCQSENSYNTESRDHQTQNACSALLQLAGICANDEDPKHTTSPLVAVIKGNISDNLYMEKSESVVSPFRTINSKSALESTLSPLSSDAENLNENHPILFGKQLAALNSKAIVQNEQLQNEDQPLNLCKEKEKTFRASNQQLIDHLVDKFLCDSPSHSNNNFSSVLNPSFNQFLSTSKAHINNMTVAKEKCLYTGFTLSDAIESAVEQAYNNDFVNTNKTEQAVVIQYADRETSKCVSQDVFGIENAPDFENSHKVGTERKKEKNDLNSCEGDSTTTLNVPHSISLKFSLANKTEAKIGPTDSFTLSNSSSSSGEKLNKRSFFHHKKSRMWCDIFMNEQMKSSKSSDNSKKSLASISPVRRSSQRTCKGRRYQALITEGLLQSAKERKYAGVRKPLTSAEKTKSRNHSDESSAILSTSKKKRKKEFTEKSKAYFKPEDDLNKCMFDLEKKIAALPKCDIETLKKKKNPGSEVATDKEDTEYPKFCVSLTNSPTSTTSKESAVCGDSDSAEQMLFANECHTFNDSSYSKSSGRFKMGGFDLEHHIASLPKCDIEMLSKRKTKN